MGEDLLEPLTPTPSQPSRGCVASDRQQGLLRDGGHVGVLAVTQRGGEPEAGVVAKVAVALHTERAPRGALANVLPPGGEVAMGGGAEEGGLRCVGGEVEANHRRVRVDLTPLARAKEGAPGADDGT